MATPLLIWKKKQLSPEHPVEDWSHPSVGTILSGSFQFIPVPTAVRCWLAQQISFKNWRGSNSQLQVPITGGRGHHGIPHTYQRLDTNAVHIPHLWNLNHLTSDKMVCAQNFHARFSIFRVGLIPTSSACLDEIKRHILRRAWCMGDFFAWKPLGEMSTTLPKLLKAPELNPRPQPNFSGGQITLPGPQLVLKKNEQQSDPFTDLL